MIHHEWLTIVDEHYPVILDCSVDADGEFLIPEGVIGIAPYAFKDCTLLKDIILPESLLYIHQDAFVGCQIEMFFNYDGVRYVGTASNPYKFLIGPISPFEITRCRIHEDCEVICEGAFENCSNLTQVIFNHHLSIIDISAFSGTGLTEIDLPDGLDEVAPFCFQSCQYLRRIKIPESVQTIGYAAFEDCVNLTTVDTINSIAVIYDNAFHGCPKLDMSRILK